jgi:hypothetical protein
MKRSFVQCAKVLLEPGADQAAPGGAVTLALCGSWDHVGACCWPHHTSATWDERHGRVRVVFAADEKDEDPVRALIDQALASGKCVGPDGKLSRWQATEQCAGVLSEGERAWGAKISESPDVAEPHGDA